jgi:hypothetical protein
MSLVQLATNLSSAAMLVELPITAVEASLGRFVKNQVKYT